MSPHPASGFDTIPQERKNHFQAGFTLIEIAVVIVIVSMAMLLVIPRLPASDRENLKISARTLASTPRYMQERAATSRTVYSLTLVPGTESIKIHETSPEVYAVPIRGTLLKPEIM